jgi:glycosyltransferase involved in cell wall biosynthesis
MRDPLVSVLVTVYNRERYLAPCLDSILASTISEFEIVLLDDGSSDQSVTIAKKYAARDSRIRFYENAKNLGDYPNRMRAAQLARGKYLKYVDSDDLIYRHSLAIMVEAMEANPEASLGLCHSLPEDEQPYPWRLSPAEAWQKQFLGRGCLNCGPSGTIIRREAFFEIGGFRDWGVLNDTDLWYRMSARWPVVLLPPGLVWWRRHEGQEFTKGDAAMVYREIGFQLGRDALESNECPLADSPRRLALMRHKAHHARRILSLALKSGHPRLAWESYRRSGLAVTELLAGFRPYRQ